MTENIGHKPAQLHPLCVAVKRSWEKLIITHDIKQDYLAQYCGVDKSRVSRWKSPEHEDFPPTAQMAKFIEGIQSWPGVEPWEPLDAFNTYFGCHAQDRRPMNESVTVLAGLLAGQSGRVLQAILQALSPDGPGGVSVTQSEALEMAPAISNLRRIICCLDDQLSMAKAS